MNAQNLLSHQGLLDDGTFIENEREKANMAFDVPKLSNKLNGKRKKILKFEKKLHREMKMMDNEFYTVDSFVSNFRSQQENGNNITNKEATTPTVVLARKSEKVALEDSVVSTTEMGLKSNPSAVHSTATLEVQSSPVSSPPPSPSVAERHVFQSQQSTLRSGMLKHRKFSHSMSDKNWQAQISSYEESLKNITQETQPSQSWINTMLTRKFLWGLIVLFVLLRYWYILWNVIAYVLRI